MLAIRMTAWVCGVTLLMATAATAQERQREGQQPSRQPGQSAQGGQQQQQQHQFCAASKLAQMPVKTQDGQQIGMVRDLLINTQTGQIGYLAVSATGQQPGEQPQQPGAQAQAQLVVIPWEAIQQPQQQQARPGQPQQQPQHLTVKLEKDRLKEAPRFTAQQLLSPQGGNQWMAKVNEFYDVGQTNVARPENRQQQQQQQQQQQNRQQNRQQNQNR